MVISAVAEARAQVPLGLVLIGDGLDRARVMRAAAGKPYVHVMPAIRDRRRLATLLASGDALVHGCESETFGLVPAEALASGLPLVAPDRGGCAQLADPAVAEVYRSGHAGAAAAAIRRLFARDPAVLKASVMRAARGVRSDVEHFTGLFDHYLSLTQRERPVRAAP
jgi:alpha-1,6-mannosyltransferase